MWKTIKIFWQSIGKWEMALTNGLIKGGNIMYFQLPVVKENKQIEELCNYKQFIQTQLVSKDKTMAKIQLLIVGIVHLLFLLLRNYHLGSKNRSFKNSLWEKDWTNFKFPWTINLTCYLLNGRFM